MLSLVKYLLQPCLLIPIVAIGLYPKLATSTYDLKTEEVAFKSRAALPVIAQQKEDFLKANVIIAISASSCFCCTKAFYELEFVKGGHRF